MRERPNRHAWKACVGQPTVGSNPTPSAKGIPSDLLQDSAYIGIIMPMREPSCRTEATTEQTQTPGVIDVHSGSTEKALDGTTYKDW